jgi:hypothetical protein
LKAVCMHHANILFQYKLADDVVGEVFAPPASSEHRFRSELTWSTLSRLADIVDKVSSQSTHTRI